MKAKFERLLLVLPSPPIFSFCHLKALAVSEWKFLGQQPEVTSEMSTDDKFCSCEEEGHGFSREGTFPIEDDIKAEECYFHLTEDSLCPSRAVFPRVPTFSENDFVSVKLGEAGPFLLYPGEGFAETPGAPEAQPGTPRRGLRQSHSP